MTGRHRAPAPLYYRRGFWHAVGLFTICSGAVVQSFAPLGVTAGLCLGGLGIQYLAVRPTIVAYLAGRHRAEA